MRLLKEQKEEEAAAGMIKPSFGSGSMGAVFNVGVEDGFHENEAEMRLQE